MNKKILLSIAVLAVVAGSYVVFHKEAKAPEGDGNQTATYEWRFTESEADGSGVPHTAVSLTTDGRTYAVGTYAGSCYQVTPEGRGVVGDVADVNEVSRMQCWFAGSGDEVGVFREGDKTVIKAGELGEGDEETGPFRGNFKIIFEL